MTTDFADIASGSRTGGATAVVLVGPPGAGKGTLGRSLGQLTGWPHLAAGDLLRDWIRQNGHGSGASLQANLAGGNFAPDALVTDLLRQRLQGADCRHGYLLDGFPRNLAQAEVLMDWMRESTAATLLIHLDVEYNEMVVRLSGRMLCPDCGAIYHKRYRPPAQVNLCDSDGGFLAGRSDDSPEVMAHRWEVYLSQTRPVLEFLEGRGLRPTTIRTTHASPSQVLEVAKRLVAPPAPQAGSHAR